MVRRHRRKRKKRITCPETAHLESVEYEEDPDSGRIVRVLTCTRFSPIGAVTCDELCAERLNRRLARAGDLGEGEPPSGA